MTEGIAVFIVFGIVSGRRCFEVLQPVELAVEQTTDAQQTLGTDGGCQRDVAT